MLVLAVCRAEPLTRVAVAQVMEHVIADMDEAEPLMESLHPLMRRLRGAVGMVGLTPSEVRQTVLVDAGKDGAEPTMLEADLVLVHTAADLDDAFDEREPASASSVSLGGVAQRAQRFGVDLRHVDNEAPPPPLDDPAPPPREASGAWEAPAEAAPAVERERSEGSDIDPRTLPSFWARQAEEGFNEEEPTMEAVKQDEGEVNLAGVQVALHKAAEGAGDQDEAEPQSEDASHGNAASGIELPAVGRMVQVGKLEEAEPRMEQIHEEKLGRVPRFGDLDEAEPGVEDVEGALARPEEVAGGRFGRARDKESEMDEEEPALETVEGAGVWGIGGW